ncbi:hypothetical protein BKA56DRAFT_49224 [Ilyonectria sp. MPI-CAGE-AT-0026]|nr:hypothetical protein BKA56DRAFT_49224 [Ilyonectria sp. MPI-CAGE-AT-0026]
MLVSLASIHVLRTLRFRHQFSALGNVTLLLFLLCLGSCTSISPSPHFIACASGVLDVFFAVPPPLDFRPTIFLSGVDVAPKPSANPAVPPHRYMTWTRRRRKALQYGLHQKMGHPFAEQPPSGNLHSYVFLPSMQI